MSQSNTENEVAVRTDGQVGFQDAATSSAIMAKVMELASAPGINPEMFDRLVAWQEREQARRAEMAFNVAMNAAQAEIQPVVRRSENKQTNSFYAKLEVVDAAIRPIYLVHGFSVEYGTVPPLVPGNIRVECRVSHTGHSRLYYREAPADTLGPKGAPVKTILHGGGSTETFLKRYAVTGAFNVVFKNQDDDGNRGGMVLLNADQVQTLVAMLQEGKLEESRFLTRMVSDVHSFEEVEVKDYDRLVSALQERIDMLKAKS